MSEDKTQDTVEEEKVGPGAYIALLAALVFFSGIFYKIDGYKWLGALDFTTLAGAFGQISGKTFVGSGGIGARSGFLFALSLVPTVMLALGILEIVTYYGAIRAAQKLMTPLLYPILGIPGRTGLALITDLQSTDAGAALTKGLADQGQITKKRPGRDVRLAVFGRRAHQQLLCHRFGLVCGLPGAGCDSAYCDVYSEVCGCRACPHSA